MRLDGKTALVTGATTGIGRAAAERLIAEGAAPLLAVGRDADRLAEAATALGPAVVPIRADLATLAGAAAMAEAAAAALDGRPLDILFANAGLGAFAPFEAADEAFFDAQFALNVKGLFFTVQKLLPLMREGSSVVLNASAVNGKGLAGAHVYNATKAAVRSFARTLAAELGPRGIRVNAVSPGYVPTPFQGKMGLPPDVLEGFAAGVVAATPLRRTGEAAEIAAAVAFLASPDAAYVNAVDIAVDGGWANV